MINFKTHYDSENDDLFLYLDGAKSSGSIEAGDLIFDFDEKGNLVAMQVTEASKFFRILLSKSIILSNSISFKAEATKFRNIESVRFTISDDFNKETANILVPRITNSSPSLEY